MEIGENTTIVMSGNRLNNIFNKKNVEYELDGTFTDLPYQSDEDVGLKSNQIIFTAINYSLQKLLDNDLYNEVLLKKFINEGQIAGPRYAFNMDMILNSDTNKKFILSNSSGISVVHKNEVPIEKTLEGPFLSTHIINEIDFIEDSGYNVGTDGGIWHSKNRRNWEKSIDSNTNVVEICYNENFAKNDSLFNPYQFLAVDSDGGLFGIKTNDLSNNKWEVFKNNSQLSSFCEFDGNSPQTLFSAKNDKLYVGTNKGLYSMYGKSNEEVKCEPFSRSWSINDFLQLDDVKNKDEQYLLATNFGVKQSRSHFLFQNLKYNGEIKNFTINSLDYVNGKIIVGTNYGLYSATRNSTTIEQIGLNRKHITGIDHVNGRIYISTTTGLYYADMVDDRWIFNQITSINNESILNETTKLNNVKIVGNNIVVVQIDNKNLYYANTDSLRYWYALSENNDNPNISKINDLKNINGALYVIANKGVYKYAVGEGKSSFMFVESVFDKKQVSIIKTEKNGDIVLFSNNKLYILNSSVSEAAATINVGSNVLDCAFSSLDEVFVLKSNGEIIKYNCIDETNELIESDNRINKISLYVLDGISYLLCHDTEGCFFALNTSSGNREIIKNNISIQKICSPFFSYVENGNNYIGMVITVNTYMPIETEISEEYAKYVFKKKRFVSETDSTIEDINLGICLSTNENNTAITSLNTIFPYATYNTAFIRNLCESPSLSGIDYIGYARDRDSNYSIVLRSDSSQLSASILSSSTGNDWNVRHANITARKFTDAYVFDSNNNLQVGYNYIVDNTNKLLKKSTTEAAVPFILNQEQTSALLPFNSTLDYGETHLFGSNYGLFKFVPNTIDENYFQNVEEGTFNDKTIVWKDYNINSYYYLLNWTEDGTQLHRTNIVSDDLNILTTVDENMEDGCENIPETSIPLSFRVIDNVKTYTLSDDDFFTSDVIVENVYGINTNNISSLYVQNGNLIVETKENSETNGRYRLSRNGSNLTAIPLDDDRHSLEDIAENIIGNTINRISSCLSVKHSVNEFDYMTTEFEKNLSTYNSSVYDFNLIGTYDSGVDICVLSIDSADIVNEFGNIIDLTSDINIGKISISGPVGLSTFILQNSSISSVTVNVSMSAFTGYDDEIFTENFNYTFTYDSSVEESITIDNLSVDSCNIKSNFKIIVDAVIEPNYNYGIIDTEQNNSLNFKVDFRSLNVQFVVSNGIRYPIVLETNDGYNYTNVENLKGFNVYSSDLNSFVNFDGYNIKTFNNFNAKERSQRILFVLCNDEDENKLYYIREDDDTLYQLYNDKNVCGIDATISNLIVYYKNNGSGITIMKSRSNDSLDFFNVEQQIYTWPTYCKLATTFSDVYYAISLDDNRRTNIFRWNSTDSTPVNIVSRSENVSSAYPWSLYSTCTEIKYIDNGNLTTLVGSSDNSDLKSITKEAWSTSILGEFYENINFHNKVYVTENGLYYKSQCYSFDDSGFGYIDTSLTGIRDIITVTYNGIQKLIYATANSLSIADIDLSNIENFSDGISIFNNIRAIYVSKAINGQLDFLILDGEDLYTFKNLNSILTDEHPRLSNTVKTVCYNALNDSNSYANFYNNFLLVGDKAYDVSIENRITISETIFNINRNVEEFYPTVNGTIYAITKSNTYENSNSSNNYWNSINELNIENTFDEQMSLIKSIVNKNATRIIAYKPGETADAVDYLNSSSDISYDCDSNTINGIFRIGNDVYATTNEGIYGMVVLPNGLHKRNSWRTDKNCTAFEELRNDKYVLNYINENTDNNDYTLENHIETNLFDDFTRRDEFINEIASNFSGSRLTRMDVMFNKYLVFSNIGNIVVYDMDIDEMKYPNVEQLQYPIKFKYDFVNAMVYREQYGIVGIGEFVETFDGFGYGFAFGNITKSYSILANSFKNDVYRIDNAPINKFMIGTKTGARYVYDNKFTRSFLDRNNRKDSLLNEVKVIERCVNNSGTVGYIVAQKNVLYEIYDPKNGKYKKILTLPEDITVTSLYVVQNNEFIIGTTKGIYITSLKYEIVDDFRNHTFKTTIDAINEKLKAVINKHIEDDHNKNSVITKLNKKMSNRLPMVSIENMSTDILRKDISNGLRHVVGDIIESIEINNDGDSTGYVKIAVKNIATSSSKIETVNLFGDTGFISEFIDPTSNKVFNIAYPSYICKNYSSGLKEIYIYVPSTATYYLGNPYGVSNSQYANTSNPRENLNGLDVYNTLDGACTTLRVYLYNNHFNIKTILATQCVGNSLPLKIYKDNVYADDSWKGLFNSLSQPSALRSLPIANGNDSTNITNLIDASGRLVLDFSIYGTDAQAIRIIAES